MDFIGFDNYLQLFHDDVFLASVRNSVILGLVVPLVTITLALILAILLTIGGSKTGSVSGLKGSGFYRVISFFPYTIPGIIVGIIWAQIYDPARGILNGILTRIGLDQFTDFAWLGDPRTAMAASIVAIIWGFVGFYMVLFVAAIQGIETEVFEAARLDGAGRFRTGVSIVLPMIRDNIRTAYVYLGIMALDAFVYMAALNAGGGPDNSTLVMSQMLFRTAFTKSQFGYATAMGVVMAIVTLIFAALVFFVSRLTEGRKGTAR